MFQKLSQNKKLKNIYYVYFINNHILKSLSSKIEESQNSNDFAKQMMEFENEAMESLMSERRTHAT